MKTEDFERLKDVCEKEGFDIELSSPWDQTYKISKKDPWEGVEFVTLVKCANGFVYKVIKQKDNEICIIANGNQWFSKSMFVPSNEQAYVEQLKKEAFERFGEIKVGDMFIGADREESRVLGNPSFHYWKSTDHLNFGSVPIYFKGKWAERVKERVYVTHKLENYFCDSLIVKFSTGYVENPNDIAKFLAQQLEKYLNNEIE